MLRACPFILLFFSGFSALVYQVVWMREFRLVFGASTAATGAVSALFMAGLGVGGWWLGPKVDRNTRPLALYGLLELAVSILAAISPWLLLLCRWIYFQSGGQLVLGFWGATAARLLLAAIVVMIPAILMGGTLPAAARSISSAGDGARRGLGLLYGINTLGALCGVLFTNFFLLEMWGARMTLYGGVLVNLIVALVAIGVGKKLPEMLAEVHSDDATPEPLSEPIFEERYVVKDSEVQSNPSVGLPLTVALMTAVGVGFMFFLMELVWYRMLAPLLGGSTYTFGLILACALAGIGIGGLLYPVLFRKIRPTAWFLAGTCLLEALFTMIPYALGDRLAALTMQLGTLSAMGFWGAVALWTVITLIVVFPAALISGIQFPLLIALMGQGRKGIGRQTGLAYAFNTAGAIAGSLAGSFGLLPLLGATGAWRLCGLLLTILGFIIAFFARRATPHEEKARGSMTPALFSLLVLVLIAWCFLAVGPTAAWRHSPIGAGRTVARNTLNGIRSIQADTRRVMLWQTDGVESSVAITKNNGITFMINGKSDGSVIGDRGTQIMVGMIGAALHPAPKKAMVVGLGTGCTAGWLTEVEGMERVDVVELEEAVLVMARLCAPANNDVIGKAERGEGVRIIINDARETLVTAPEKYDIIVSEPSNPYRAGIASLFSKEFYHEVRNRLTNDGIFVNWCQAYEVTPETVFSILGTLKSVFPYVECWTTQGGDLSFVSAMHPIIPDSALLARRLEQPSFRNAMRIAWDAEGFDAFVSRFVATDSFVSNAVRNSIINTDDKMQIEYAFARTVGRPTGFNIATLLDVSRRQQQDLPHWLPAGANRDAIAVNRAIWTQNPVHVASSPQAQARYGSLANWRSGNYSLFNKTWSDDDPGVRKIERVALAEVLASRNDPAFLGQVAFFEEQWPATAAFIRARFASNGDDAGKITKELVTGFTLLRESCWEVESVTTKSLDYVAPFVAKNPEYAEEIYRALEKPFSLNMLEHPRLQLLLQIAQTIGSEKMAETYAKHFEPNVSWEFPFLFKRMQSYLVTKNPLLDRAVDDFQKFVGDDTESIQFYLRRQADIVDLPLPELERDSEPQVQKVLSRE